jgi:ABC-2 type transport system ATP-binding protein
VAGRQGQQEVTLPPAPAIDVVDLRKVYVKRGSSVRAVDGLSFSVMPGSIFGLLGPNGAGKTTTIRILTTLLRPTGGSATIAGFDLLREPLQVRRNIAVVIQESAAELFLSVRDNLTTYARFRGMRGPEIGPRVDRVLEEFGLAAEAGTKAADLSGGYRRRIQVAKTFLVDTPVLFLDEFSAGMDPILKRTVMDRLRASARAGRTIVLTTHILQEAEELCDDVLIVRGGKQIARGTVDELRQAGGNDRATLEDVFVQLVTEESDAS